MVAYSRTMLAVIEAKSVIVKPGKQETGNASVELVQLCALGAWAKLGFPIHYCFGRAGLDSSLEAWMIRLEALKPSFIGLTPRSTNFSLKLEAFSRKLFPKAIIKLVDVSAGSNTPYALIPKDQIISAGVPFKLWLDQNSGGGFGMAERISWEGRDEAKQHWSHIRYSQWRIDE